MVKWLSDRFSKSNIMALYGCLWLVATFIMMQFYNQQLEINYYTLIKTVMAMVIIGLPLLLFGRLLVMNIGMNVLFAILMMANVLYFRYFSEIITLARTSSAVYLGEVLSSVLALIRLRDVVIIVWAFVSVILVRLIHNQVKDYRKLATIGLVLIVVSVLIYGSLAEGYKKSINKETFVVSLFGVEEEVMAQAQVNPERFADMMKEEEVMEDSYLNGLSKGRNLILIQVESLQDMVLERTYLEQAITPHLNGLIQEDTLYFTNIYQQLSRSNTADAEWVVHNSLYAPMTGKAYEDYLDKDYDGLPWLLKKEGYKTLAFHGNEGAFWNREAAYPGQGFDDFVSLEDLILDEPLGLGLGDQSFLKQSVDILGEVDQPFYALLVTLTSHHPFDLEIDQDFQISEEDEGTIFGQYLESIHYTDNAIGLFIEDLQKADLYKNSVIVIYGDHFGLNPNDAQIKEQVSAYMGYPYDFDLAMNIPLIVHIPGYGVTEKIDIVGGQVDVLPTLVNLFGINDHSPYQMGQDLLNPVREGIAVSQTYMLKGSFIDQEKVFEMSRDGIFAHSRAWLIETSLEVAVESCREQYEGVIEMIDRSNYILDNNLMKAKLVSVDGSAEVELQTLPQHPTYVARLDGDTISESAIDGADQLNKAVAEGYVLIELELVEAEGSINIQVAGDPTMTFDHLIEWMKVNESVRVLTKTTGDPYELLANISAKHPDLKKRFIPQINNFDAYVKVSYMGYQDIVLRLDKTMYDQEEIIDFVQLHKVFAVTIREELAKGPMPSLLNQLGVFVYVDTMESRVREDDLFDNKVNGSYVDVEN